MELVFKMDKTMINAMTRLQESCKKNGPLCVGLDMSPAYLPPEVIKKFDTVQDAVLAYNEAIIEAVKGNASCFKVQVAYYEAMGLKGMEVYAKTLKAVRKTGLPVISDIKRGDIADTATAYAKAHFSGDFETDIVTVNPYMGFDTLLPFVEYTKTAGKGIFVLLRTSNPGMVDIEQQELVSGERVLDRVGNHLATLSKEFFSFQETLVDSQKSACSPIGAVVGCTEESDAQMLREKYPQLFFLIPGYGAQGGKARIAATLLKNAGGTVNSSRGIIASWKKDESLQDKRDAGVLTLSDIAESAGKAALASKKDLLLACDELLK